MNKSLKTKDLKVMLNAKAFKNLLKITKKYLHL